jgi:hypothetical protein
VLQDRDAARRIGKRIALLDRDAHRAALEYGEHFSGAIDQLNASPALVT